MSEGMKNKECLIEPSVLPTILEIKETSKANKVDMRIYRLDRFSETKDAWILIKRKRILQNSINDDFENFLEVSSVDIANTINMEIYRYECFSELRGTYLFVKRTLKGD